MEMNSFGEDLIVKTRKPYTITKQREKWTDEEHNRFLEALKLYGRAWQRIEEHIGTKTAIQIRSHAQKFFTKLEKEAVTTGSPLGQAHDIDIPPPRPKKKPNYPYPRKTGLCSISPATQAADKKTSKTMNPLPQEINKQEASIAAKSLQETKECSDEANCSAVLNLFKDAPSAARDKSSKNQVSFREFVPMTTQPKELPSLKGGSSLTIEVNLESTSNETDQALRRASGINRELHELSEGSSKGEEQLESEHEAKDMQTNFIHGSNPKATVEDEGYSPSSELINHTIPATSFISHPFPTFPPFAQLSTTQDLYRSFSSAFCRQIVSTLQQNPAAHAAACMAALSLSTSEEMDSSSMAAIATVTVAAASAWWATNGLIPFFPAPIHASGFAYSPPVCSFPVSDTTTQIPKEKMEETLEKQAILSSSSSSSLEKIEKKISSFKPLSDAAYHNAMVRKHERSSCGSNTTSSSEIETDGLPKKNGEETNDEDKQSSHLQNFPAGEINFRRARTSLCFNETWKEVSEEGRLAFQALFSRDILPQSFGIQLDSKAEMGIMGKEEILRLSRREEGSSSAIPNEMKHGNLKVRRTGGFKPYKRCSAEVEVLHRVSGNDETSNKKIRLQGEVSS